MATSPLVLIDPNEAKAFDIRRFALNLREQIPLMEDIDRLQELDALLVGLKTRLHQLKEDVVEAERTRVLIVQRIGQLVGDTPVKSDGDSPVPGVSRNRFMYARMLARHPDVVEKAIKDPRVTLTRAVGAVKAELAQERAEQAAEAMAGKLAELPSVHTGQWWRLGPHRLYCGDSTDGAFVEAVGAAEPVFAFADPPYNIDIADWDNGFTWAHDYLAEVASVVAVTPGNGQIQNFLRATLMHYRWTIAVQTLFSGSRSPLGFGNWIPVLLFADPATSLYHEAMDHIRVAQGARDPSETSHPTPKPIRAISALLEIFTSTGDIVVDPFLGSGTTLIAADKKDRVCIGAELDPIHCGGIVARYGKKAEPIT